MTAPLVSAAWLRERLSDDGIRIVDCRWKLGEPEAGAALWREGHIPGASFLDLDRDLAAPPGEKGRHPLPSTDDFEATARRAGIGKDTLVVAYDEAGEGGAARLWWLLRHFGHDEVTVLDGGMRAWREERGELSAGEEQIAAGDFTATTSPNDTVTAEELAPPAARRRPRPVARSSMPARRSAIGARPSRSTRSRGTSPARSTCRSPSSRPEAASSRPPSCAPASRRPECGPVATPSHTAARA